MFDIQNLTLQYGKKQLLKDVSCRIGNQDRIGLVGVNGAGKSTLLRLIAGIEQPDDGEIQLGHNIKISYFLVSTKPKNSSLIRRYWKPCWQQQDQTLPPHHSVRS